jgi:hypothetical protein
MSARIRRAVLIVAAAMLISAISTFLTGTVARLIREHRAEGSGDSVATEMKAQ